ncbi:TlpA family protein disulfide reductase [Aggregatilinea lenta]|uniref:TlpA family protein disulfide reductase n=1 Tax=Aggregatilinea lenta TaxID=913108 RepID=UPI0013C36CB0|nr:TlpA disulfide reductase family protein [Aggregatilinea lenta]
METPDFSLLTPPGPQRGPGWLLLLVLPLGGAIAALLIITLSGGEDEGGSATAAASYPSPAPVTFIPPTPLPAATAVPSLIDQPLPTFSLSTLDGDTISLPESVAGKVVFLNFWATWCVPCEEEMPALQQLQDAHGADGVEVISVTDPTSGQTEDDIRAFIDEHDLSLTVALSSELALYQTFNVLQIPITYIIDRDGTVRDYHIGALTPDDIDAYLEELL